MRSECTEEMTTGMGYFVHSFMHRLQVAVCWICQERIQMNCMVLEASRGAPSHNLVVQLYLQPIRYHAWQEHLQWEHRSLVSLVEEDQFWYNMQCKLMGCRIISWETDGYIYIYNRWTWELTLWPLTPSFRCKFLLDEALGRPSQVVWPPTTAIQA